jgi:HAD superfamily hydrolase (TIGR01509 family)
VKSPAAILFDFDGVIVDSEALHHRAYELALEPYGVHGIPKEVYADVFSNRGLGLAYCAERVPGLDVVELKHRKERYFLDLMTDSVRLLPGAVDAVRRLAAARPLALATGSLRAVVMETLGRFALDGAFRVVITREDYDREKPEPDAFLEACVRLGQAPARCLVVEDSYKGLCAARAAGIPCVVVPNDYTRAADFSGAAAVLSSLAALSGERAEEIYGAANGRGA